MVAAAVLLGRLDRRFDLVGEVASIIAAVECGPDVLQGLGLVTPAEGDRLDLHRLALAAVLLDDGEFLGTVGTGRIVEEPVAAEFEARAAAPCRFGKLPGQVFGRLRRADAPSSGVMLSFCD